MDLEDLEGRKPKRSDFGRISETKFDLKSFVFVFDTLPHAPGGYEGEHHTLGVIWFRAYSSTNLCMAFVNTDEIRTPALAVRS